ncbi:hypothetical protein NG99_01240 [Erwinia typographi]|uniref:Uncharacterized protein n=1 Tax=Erwinia typographi TaxID=371042 RepID=A0A0A3ZA73_9GAMM|nr:hypothetical protein [Erwinia typographi]KGT95795.1 hypothetical protein NG99_01240 [Erwinia typographi]
MSFFHTLTELFNLIPGWLSAFVKIILSAWFGARLAGINTIKGINAQANLTEKKAITESLKLQLSVLKGIKGEVSILIGLYNKRMRKHIDAIVPGEMLQVTFPIGEGYFTFYEQNAKEIAKLDDHSRDSIISIYTYARSMIQTYKFNNELLEDLESISYTIKEKGFDEFYRKVLNAKKDALQEYAQSIKLIDEELRVAIEKGFFTMDSEILCISHELNSKDK